MAILGIDEVGRGPLAGPLVVGAVILPEEEKEWFSDLKDSKKLSIKKRESLSDVVLKDATTGLGWVFASELDSVGISEALRIATRRAIKDLKKSRAVFSEIIIDGKVNFLKDTVLESRVTTIVKADGLIREVSAASIIAKVARDHYMYEVGKRFPEYGFEKHVGYGTAKHLAAISKYGICSEHRRSFEPIKSMVGFSRDAVFDTVVKNTTMTGKKGEEAVCEYLSNLGHKIIARNFKTKLCEIDIVSICDSKIYFTEVKYRKSDAYGGGLAAITTTKLKKMKFAAEVFLKYHNKYQIFDSDLAVADVAGDFEIQDWFLVN